MNERPGADQPRVAYWAGKAEGLWWDCPGCGLAHRVHVEASDKNRNNPVWTWNGDLVKPTFYPSVRCKWTVGENHEEKCCHFYVRDGMVQFLDDCTHEFKGQTVALPLVDHH